MIVCANSSICFAGLVRSITQSTMDAWRSFWKVRSIPRLSIVSLVSRIPAVSIKRNVIPDRLIVSSITSRVVPWMSETMARSSPTNRLSKVDLPAFVSPMMATGIPFLMALPTLNESANLCISCSMFVASCFRLVRSANSTSSSLKSSSNSINEVKSSSWLRSLVNSLLKPPRIWFIASLCMPADVDAIRSATASAWLRSIFPFRKARCVYSPGRAERHPFSISNWRICCWM